MKRFKALQICIVFMMLILGVFLITGCSKSDEAALVEAQFDSVLPGTDTCSEAGPKVVASYPDIDATSMPLTTKVTAYFSEAMAPTSIAYTDQGDPQVVTFTLYDNAHPLDLIPGTVTMSSLDWNATFTPSADLAANSKFTVTITKYAKSASPNFTPLGCNYRWEFETGDAP